MNALELDMLWMLKFSLRVTSEEYDECVGELRELQRTLYYPPQGPAPPDVENSAEEKVVWPKMVAASALQEQQAHIDMIMMETNELKSRIDGHYATPRSSTQTGDLLANLR